MPCQTPASVMIRISTSLIYTRDRQAGPDALMRQGRVSAALRTVFSGDGAVLAHLRGTRVLHTEVVLRATSGLALTLLVGGPDQGQGSCQQQAGNQKAHRGSS